jgi:hypothetical protein
MTTREIASSRAFWALLALALACGGGGGGNNTPTNPPPPPPPPPPPMTCVTNLAPPGATCPMVGGAWTAEWTFLLCGESAPRTAQAQVTQDGCRLEVVVPGFGRAVGNLDGNQHASNFWVEFEEGLPGAGTCDDRCGVGGFRVESMSEVEINFAGETGQDMDCCWNVFFTLRR